MAAPKFTITEIVGDDGTVNDDDGTIGTDALESVELTEEQQSMPEGEWEMPAQHRYGREDYPGASYDPVIQRLGANFEPQTITGLFDDKYMGPGAAKRTVEKLYRILDRGNDLKIEHEDESFVMFMANFKPAKILASRWRYTVLFEPVRRRTGTGPSSGVAARAFNASALRTPGDFRDRASSFVLGMRSTHDSMRSYQLSAGIFATLDAPLVAVETAMDKVDATISIHGTVTVAAPGTTLLQMSSAFGGLKAAARDLWTASMALGSDSSLAWQDAAGLLAFEEWNRGIAASARLTFLASLEAEAELRRRAQPDAVRLHPTYSGEHLYDISRLHYGTPARWRAIQDRNNLASLVMDGTEVLVIPETGT